MLDEGVESRPMESIGSTGHAIDYDGKVHFLFVRDLERFHSCWMRG